MPETDEPDKEDFQYIVRLANTDIDGENGAVVALQGIKGIGRRAAEIIAREANIDRVEKIGVLDESKIEELEELIMNYGNLAPGWALNRRHDYETGDDLHMIGTDLEMSRRDDINRMKMIRCYRGVRHERGQKVRGQRTRTNGRTGLTLGVSRAKQIKAAKEKKKKES